MSAESIESTLEALRPARAYVDLDRLAANHDAIAAFAKRAVMPVVKADAYGHGAVAVVRHLVACGASRVAVAYVEEGVALRRAGVTVPVVVLAGFAPSQVPALLEEGLTPVVSTETTLDALVDASARGDEPVAVHLKVDTGMSRLGFRPERLPRALDRLLSTGRTVVEGVMTHLACADEDAGATERQLDLFDAALETVRAAGAAPTWVHAANSAGLAFLRPTHTLVRPGLLLYGVRPRPLAPDIAVKPVLRATAPVFRVEDVPVGTRASYGGHWVARRPSRLATLAIGYADGVPRTVAMRQGGYVTAGEHRLPVAGTVCMDLVITDATDVPGLREGDEVTWLGDAPDAWQVSEWAGTIAWQALTAIGRRVPRVYVKGGKPVGIAGPWL